MLSSIDHIVVLMLENRSFDHMLGFLRPAGPDFEGLTGKETNPDPKGKPVPVFRIGSSAPHPYFMPGSDPGEGFLNTNSQLFGTTKPAASAKATNQGFVTNYAYTLGWESKSSETSEKPLPGTTPSDIMGVYTPELLPVLSTLASSYAMCDHWFSSAPTETLPNRAFVHMATSQGHLDDKTSLYTAPSIYPALANAGATWGIYGYDAPPLTRGNIADLHDQPESCFGVYSDFAEKAKDGSLPNYVFLEPQWHSTGNSQHPNYDVSLGEQLLAQVYNTLRTSPLWPRSLLVITYDEHGGCFDHVPPPTNATPPDDSAGEYGFDFRRFGVRVPTVLVSPLIASGTVYRSPAPRPPHDHTSILATAEKRWNVKPLTRRDSVAPDLASVLTLTKPRTDDALANVKVPKSGKGPSASNGPDHLQKVYADAASRLPLADKDGERPSAPPLFRNGKEAMMWGAERHEEYAKRR